MTNFTTMSTFDARDTRNPTTQLGTYTMAGILCKVRRSSIASSMPAMNSPITANGPIITTAISVSRGIEAGTYFKFTSYGDGVNLYTGTDTADSNSHWPAMKHKSIKAKLSR